MAFNLLVVDDSPAMRTFIRRVIRNSGLEVGECCEAADGAQALTVLRDRWMDVVLTDINMPQMNGEQLVRSMLEDEILRNVPVIVVSTDASENRVRQMMELGAQGYIPKPFAPEKLRREVERVLGVSHA